MIVRVWRQARAAGIGPVLVAAAEAEIAHAIENAGGAAVLTDPALPSGTDRVFAALEKFDVKCAHDVIVNLQGDLPLLDPAQLRIVVEALAASAPISPRWPRRSWTKRMSTIRMWSNPSSPGTRTDRWAARSTSRARAAPYGPGAVFHHIGIYAFRRVAARALCGPGAIAARTARKARTASRARSRDVDRGRAGR